MLRQPTLQAGLAILATLLVAAAIGWAGSQGGLRLGAVPVFALCGTLCFAINWLAFVPAFAAQTERYYDLTGSLTYLTAVGLALVLGNRDPRAQLLALLITVWTLRLGGFLFSRIRREGKDGRFDAIKPDFARFLLAWTLQGLWVFVTAGCALAAMTAATPAPLDSLALLGTCVWIAGFAIEAVADQQKARFRRVPASRGRFISSGLWAWSRHPNYCGEIVLWAGVAIVALPALAGPALATLVSPLFVYVLLTRISGIPLLEARSDARWGGDPEYQAYKARTPVLWLRPPASR
jgi:steroid 5-alpha reductase family enzyme